MSIMRVEVTYRGFCRRAAVLAACLVTVAQARTYDIQSNTMAISADGVCGFREALGAINTLSNVNECLAPGSTPNVINLKAQTYTSPVALNLTRNMSINCLGPGACNIDAGNFHGVLFTVTSANQPVVSLKKIVLRQPAGNSFTLSGLMVLSGTLNLDEVVVTGFRVNGALVRAGTAHNFRRSTLSNNLNAGIHVETKASVTLSQSTLTGNGYGISVTSSETYVLSHYNTISGNWTGVTASGGGLFNDNYSVISNSTDAGIHVGTSGQITLTGSIIRDNKNRGINMAVSSMAFLYNCTVDRNTTPFSGGGIYVPSTLNGGNSAFPQIFYSTISNNTAGEYGGGIFVSGTAILQNSTVSQNTAKRGGGAYFVSNSSNSYLNLTHCTMASNHASESGGGLTSVLAVGPNALNISWSIIANNTSNMHPDISGPNKSSLSLYRDLTGSTGDHSGDLKPGDPLIGPLSDNSGPYRVQTHALFRDSRARNVVPANPFNEWTDGRGFPRPKTGNWDLGAYEIVPLETELLSVVATTGGIYGTQDDSQLSNGRGTVLRANAVDAHVTYAVPVPEVVNGRSRYTITVRAKTGPDHAKVELATAPIAYPTSFTTIGTLDMYSAASGIKDFPLSFEFTSAGIKHFRLKVTGKTGTGYLCFYDYIDLSRQ